MGRAVDHLDVGNPLRVLGRGSLGPQVVGLGQVRVRINHTQAVKCESHLCSSPIRRRSANPTVWTYGAAQRAEGLAIRTRRGRLLDELRQLLGDHLIVLGEVAAGRSRAPTPPHEEDQDGEDELADEAHPPPALPLARRGLLRRHQLLLGHQEARQVLRVHTHLGVDLGLAHRLAVLNRLGERVVGEQARDLGVGEPTGRRQRLGQVVRRVAGDQEGRQGLRTRLSRRLQTGDHGRGRRLRVARRRSRCRGIGLRGLDRLQRGRRGLVVHQDGRRRDHVGQHQEGQRHRDAEDPSPDGESRRGEGRVVRLDLLRVVRHPRGVGERDGDRQQDDDEDVGVVAGMRTTGLDDEEAHHHHGADRPEEHERLADPRPVRQEAGHDQPDREGRRRARR